MKALVITSMVVFISVIIEGCQKTQRGLMNTIDNNPHGIYTIQKPIKNRCEDLRSENPVRSYSDSSDTSTCVNILPGLADLQLGYSLPNYAPRATNSPPHHEKIFHFSCDDDSKNSQDGYSVPREVKSIVKSHITHFDSYKVQSDKILDILYKHFVSNNPATAYKWFLPFSSTIKNAKPEEIPMYVSINVEEFRIDLKGATPSKSMLFNYRSLPANLHEHFLDYYNFVANYGNYFRKSATFGGSCNILYTPEGFGDVEQASLNMLPESNIIHNIKTSTYYDEASKKWMIAMFEGGKKVGQGLTQWISSVKNSPVAISSSLEPLHDFIEPNTNTEKKQNLIMMNSFETTHQDLIRVYFELTGISSFENSLLIFFTEHIRHELNRVCPSAELYAIIRDGILEPMNFDLGKFYVSCTTARKHRSDYWDVIIKRIFRLVPGVCFTYGAESGKCAEVSYNLPHGKLCIDFFEREKCEGAVVVKACSAKDLYTAFKISKSFAISQ